MMSEPELSQINSGVHEPQILRGTNPSVEKSQSNTGKILPVV
jgi:hypothetical protein